MTKEEEKTIYRLNKDKNNPLACGDITIVNVEDIETVLNMLKEKENEIEKKDKVINLMAEYINHLSDKLVQTTGRNEFEFCDENKCCKDSEYSCEQCIKQYFERKSEE